MTATPTEIQSQAIELATEAFEAFCEDIGGMFGVDMECVSQEAEHGTVMDLKKRFKKLLAAAGFPRYSETEHVQKGADMNTIVLAYLLYVIVSAALTVWVGRTLYRNGRIFLMRCFADNEELTDSVNRLLLVGFYLINFGYVCLALKTTQQVPGWREAIELMSVKIGLVLCVLGVMHFLNLYIFTRISSAKESGRRSKIAGAFKKGEGDGDGNTPPIPEGAPVF